MIGQPTPGDSAAAAAAHAYVAVLAAVPPRTLTYAGLALAVGAGVWRLLVVPRAALPAHADGVARRTLAPVALAGGFGAAAGVVAAAWALALQLGSLDAGGENDEPVGAMLAAVVGQTHWGRVWLAQTVALAVAGLAYWAARRREQAYPGGATTAAWRVGAGASMLAAALQGAGGHAGADQAAPRLAVALAGTHVLAGVAWLGTLAVLVGVWRLLRPGAGALVLPQVAAFHPVALAAAGATVVAGLGHAWLRLAAAPGGAGVAARADALVATGYGRLLLAKVAAAAVVIGAGAVNARRTRRYRAAGGSGSAPGDARAFDRAARFELAAAVAVFVLSAALAVSSPPGTE